MARIGAEPQNQVMRTTSRLLAGVGLTAVAVLGPALPAVAAPASSTTVVKPVAEAWYRSTPACALPTGCADAGGAPSPYPADTLHVGVVGGLEEARTYLQLDLGALPSGTQITGGTLLLPVAAVGGEGNRSPQTATMQACAVTAAVEDADGSFATPPGVDCKAASVPAKLVPAAGSTPAAFTVELGAFISAWASATPGAVALLPAEDTAPSASWHVAFSDRTRTGEGVVPISASIGFTSASVDTGDTDTFVPPPPVEPAPVAEAPPACDGGSFAASPLSAEVPLAPAPAPQSQAAPVAATAPIVQQVTPVAASLPTGFRYPAVFLLPLLVAVAAAWLGRALTRDLVPPAG